MVVMDADKGTVLATVDIGRGSDGCGFDPAKGLAYSSNGGDGTVTVVGEAGAGPVQGGRDHPDPGERPDDDSRPEDPPPLPLGRHLRPRPGRRAPQPKAKGRRPMVPGSFVVMVVE